MKYLTGLDCPFCGGLRAVHSMTHGQLVAALHHNALFVLGSPFLVLWWVAWLRRDLAGTPRVRRHGRAVDVALICLAVTFMVVRNLPLGAALAAGSVH